MWWKLGLLSLRLCIGFFLLKKSINPITGRVLLCIFLTLLITDDHVVWLLPPCLYSSCLLLEVACRLSVTPLPVCVCVSLFMQLWSLHWGICRIDGHFHYVRVWIWDLWMQHKIIKLVLILDISVFWTCVFWLPLEQHQEEFIKLCVPWDGCKSRSF